MEPRQQQWMRNGRFGDRKWIDAVRHSAPLAFESERNVFPFTMEQRFVLPYKVPQRSPRDVEAAAAECGFRKIVVGGVEHAIGVVDTGRERALDAAVLRKQLIVGIALRKLFLDVRVKHLREGRKTVAGTVMIECIRPTRSDDV